MTTHYFTGGPADLPLEQVMIEWGGHSVRWTVAPGIFATRGLDDGSRLLLDGLTVASGQKLLDLGCGSGPLGLLPHLRTPGLMSVMVDVNPTALRCAVANAAALGIKTALCVLADGADAIQSAQFDVAVTNPPIRAGRKVVEGILRGGSASLKSGGAFYMVVRVQQGGWTLADRLEEIIGSKPELVRRRKGYLVFRAVKSPPG